MFSLRRQERELKTKLVGLFEDLCEGGLCTIKFYLLDHLYEDLEKLCSIQFKMQPLVKILTLF